MYMITGPDGRPQLLAPVGTRLMVVPSDGGQQMATAEAGSAQIYELNVPGPRVNELDARQRDRVIALGRDGQSW